MNPLPMLALVIVGALFGFASNNQPARPESRVDSDESAFGQMGQVNWVLVAIWSFVFLSFAALFVAGCIIWIRCHTDFPH